MLKEKMIDEIKDFNMPAYNEIPNVGLFLEQVAKYIGEYLAPFDSVALTSSMISNYVKKDIISNPVKKQYNREQISRLFFIAMAKNVLSLEDIQLLFEIQEKTCDSETAYEYFRTTFKKVLFQVFDMESEVSEDTERNRDAKLLLKNTVTTMVHKIYLDKYFKLLRAENPGKKAVSRGFRKKSEKAD